MSAPRWGLLALLAVGAVVLLAPLLDSDAFPDAPDDFATFSDGQVSFRHPRDWRVERGSGVVTITAPSGPGIVVVRRTASSGDAAWRGLERGVKRLRRGWPESVTQYELDSPGHEDLDVGDEVFHFGRGRRERVETLTLPNGGGGLVHLAVRGTVSDDPEIDPRAIMGSFRFVE